MESLINSLQEANRKFQIATKELLETKAEANRLATEARILKNKNDARTIDLDEREASLKPIEDLNSSVAKAKQLGKDTASEAAVLRGDREDFEIKKSNFLKEISVEKGENRRELERLNNSSKSVQEARTKLEEEKKTYKQKVLDEIKAKVG